jgi:hypothetical protein
MSESKWPRRVTIQVEIVEENEGCGFLHLIFDNDYHSTAYLNPRLYERSNLYGVLYEILQKYRPRMTIEGSIQEIRQGESE